MLSESIRRRLEHLNRQPLAADPQRVPSRRAMPRTIAPQKNAAITWPALLTAAEVVTNPSGEHLRMRLPIAQINASLLAQQRSRLAAARSTEATPWHAELDALLASFPSRTLFLDLETCGFAGSAIFLIGILRELAGELCLELLLAKNYVQERAILHSLWLAAQDCDVLVTYNGKSFDWPMVQDRTTYHRFGAGDEVQRTNPVHCDLLHHARRRWKESLPDCRLQTLEYCLCGRRRADDIPGHRIPRAYHDFVRHGDPTEIESILQHNAQDLITLLEIALRIF